MGEGPPSKEGDKGTKGTYGCGEGSFDPSLNQEEDNKGDVRSIGRIILEQDNTREDDIERYVSDYINDQI